MKPLGKLRYLQHEKKVSVNFATATDKDIFRPEKIATDLEKKINLLQVWAVYLPIINVVI